ncbi:four helix bundle protein [Roseisolibacter sp. H3M3-2]|uniref:four helix bundle protein n=1 Tax=Roseisolibacter sp. H3M3-2 TaxID=3031323 RepID=UPI0023DC8648|nr:four helix bundle protein [Roseisolibacter sp. H3M3-2]MDF1503898.1 four helix bundle protein [Roseisolibacter sp. H3M3-2]
MHAPDADFERWAAEPGNASAERLVWRLAMYRLACYALHTGWDDALRLARSPIAAPIAAQLYRALGSIGANIAEGYSRGSGRDRVRFYEYALGSARESTHWYRAAEPVLGLEVAEARRAILHRTTLTLLAAIPAERDRLIRRAER